MWLQWMQYSTIMSLNWRCKVQSTFNFWKVHKPFFFYEFKSNPLQNYDGWYSTTAAYWLFIHPTIYILLYLFYSVKMITHLLFNNGLFKVNLEFSFSFPGFSFSGLDLYLAHVIEQPNFRIPNPQYFVYLLDQTVGRDILQFIYWNHATFSNSF